MTIKTDWKYKVYISFLVLACVGLLAYFTYLAIIEAGNSIVILPADQFAQSFR